MDEIDESARLLNELKGIVEKIRDSDPNGFLRVMTAVNGSLDPVVVEKRLN